MGNVFRVITFLLNCGMRIQEKRITPATSQHYILRPITNQLHSLNCWHDYFRYETVLPQIYEFH